MNNQDYIANSISRILMAECHPSQAYTRAIVIANAVRIAASAGEQAAHDYLKSVVRLAESGHFAEPESDAGEVKE